VPTSDANQYVFNSQKSTQLNRVTIYKLFKAIEKTAGLGVMLQHPHVLKHTNGSARRERLHDSTASWRHRSFDSTLAYVNPSDADASAASAKAFSQVFERALVSFAAPILSHVYLAVMRKHSGKTVLVEKRSFHKHCAPVSG